MPAMTENTRLAFKATPEMAAAVKDDLARREETSLGTILRRAVRLLLSEAAGKLDQPSSGW
jgi:hypothetical protein